MHLWLLIKDAWRAQRWWDKLRIWFMPLGWRPADVASKYPVFKITDVYHFEKYHPKISSSVMTWSWIQMFVVFFFISYLFGKIADIGVPSMFVYGAFIFLSVYAYTELMTNAVAAVDDSRAGPLPCDLTDRPVSAAAHPCAGTGAPLDGVS